MMPHKLGILGGMGPLASAEFLANLYRLNIVEPEQEAPACILYSDPAIPDRTEAILKGTIEGLVRDLSRAVGKLVELGCDRVLIACITAHHVLPSIPASLRDRLISLIDLAVDGMLASPRVRLMLATTGTRRARIFEEHGRWPLAEPWVIFPGDEDQQELHRWIYRLKRYEALDHCVAWLDSMTTKYGTEGFVFGCTELHLLQRLFVRNPESARAEDWIIDPLMIAVRSLPELMKGSGGSRLSILHGRE
jgi:aspartate racemase